jgi:hypothetical protein
MTLPCGNKVYGARPILQVSENIQKRVHSNGGDASGLPVAVTWFELGNQIVSVMITMELLSLMKLDLNDQ